MPKLLRRSSVSSALQDDTGNVEGRDGDGGEDALFGDRGSLPRNGKLLEGVCDMEDPVRDEDVDSGAKDKVGPVPPGQNNHQVLWRAIDASCLHPDMELKDIRLQSDLARPCEHVHVPPPQERREVTEHHVAEYWDERRERVDLVVIPLLEGEVLEIPPQRDDGGHGEESSPGHQLLRRRKPFDGLELVVTPWEAECADHAEDPDEMVESGTEEPLVPRGVLRMEGIVEIEKKLERREDGLEGSGNIIKDDRDNDGHEDLSEEHNIVRVEL
mmetsp:Transcript_39358/g.89372  ORF Transcript_39358/g.89372 Transcript_39358/m.89372 type:complete len:271 (-) Transcript_39358:318-1130(-)